jgi:predicted enzyme related to lactoylglutathione lyase
MLKLMKLVGVPTRDQERALHFWTKQVGMIVVTDQPMGPDMRWIELKLPDAETGIALFTPPGHEARIGQFTGISFGCDDVEKTHRELVERGVTFPQAPKKEPWGTSAIFADTEGNSFVLATIQ